MKIKGFSGVKHHEGERYVFKKSRAVVPGIRLKGKPVTISIMEFNKLCKQ